MSEEKLLDLLEIAMSADTAETVKRSRELMDSGVDPMALMSQLAGLIMDIIAGTYRLADPTCGGEGIGGRNSEFFQFTSAILSSYAVLLNYCSSMHNFFHRISILYHFD